MAVYTTVSADDLVAWLTRYALGTVREFEPIVSGIENTNYFVSADNGRFVLTLYERLPAEGAALSQPDGAPRHAGVEGRPRARSQRRAVELSTASPRAWSRDSTARRSSHAMEHCAAAKRAGAYACCSRKLS
jgi:hypothetical protein